MSLHIEIANRISEARATATHAGISDNFGPIFAVRALRTALLVSEPTTAADARVHATTLAEILGETLAGGSNSAILDDIEHALDTLANFLASADVTHGDAPGRFVAAAAAELADTWQQYDTAQPGNRCDLIARGAAIERAVITSRPNTIGDAAILADVLVRWVRDATWPPADARSKSSAAGRLELIEVGTVALAAGLAAIAGMASPFGRPAFVALA